MARRRRFNAEMPPLLEGVQYRCWKCNRQRGNLVWSNRVCVNSPCAIDGGFFVRLDGQPEPGMEAVMTDVLIEEIETAPEMTTEEEPPVEELPDASEPTPEELAELDQLLGNLDNL